MLNGLGTETGVDMNHLLDAAQFICNHLGRPTMSRAGRALSAKRDKAAA
jgi:hydroxymethylglutaryl-CoA lyase